MSIAALCTVDDMPAVNSALNAAGHGPSNFSVSIYGSTGRPTHAALHAWDDADFLAALQADTRVTLDTSEDGKPRDRVQALIDAQGLAWPGNAPMLPDTGTVMPGEYYRTQDGAQSRYWRVIQQHDRSAFGGDPEQYPALIREARVPGQVREWKQPIDQFDAYLTLDPFTGKPDRVTYDGATWEAVDGSAGGPGGALLNTWEPGVFGWTQV